MDPADLLQRQRHSRRTKSASEILKGRPMLPPPPPEFDMSIWQQRLAARSASASPFQKMGTTPTPSPVSYDKSVQATVSTQNRRCSSEKALKAAQDYTLKVKLDCEQMVKAEKAASLRALEESKGKVSELERELELIKRNKQQEILQLQNRLRAMQASYESAMKLVEELEKLARRTGHLEISKVRKPFINTLGSSAKKNFNSIVLDIKKYPSTFTYVEKQ